MIFGRKEKIQIKTAAELELMRLAGLVVARTLKQLETEIVPGMTTLDIDAIARENLKREGANSSFLGYHGYPAVVCTSTNDEIVHGIPSERVLNDGDIVSVDFGAIIEGWHGDAARTYFVGQVSDEAKKLSDVTRRSMWAGLAAAVIGNKLFDISHAVENVVRADGAWGIVEEYVGHGIGNEMHMYPNVPNYGRGGHGPDLLVGMTFAIEPMITAGRPDNQVLDDDWTVTTLDGSIASHWENTVAVTELGPWVLTELDGGYAEFKKLGIDVPERSN
jgi:methionyl aminopeptidase